MASARQPTLLFADPRTRRKVQMQDEGKERYSVASLATSNLLLVVSLGGAKAWLLSRQVSAFPLAVLELTVGAGIVLVTAAVHGRAPFDFLSEGPAVAMAAVLQLLQHSALFFALSRISLVRVLAFTQFSSLWLNSVLSPSSIRRALASLLALALSVVVDVAFNSRTPADLIPAHVALLLHAVASTGLNYAQASIIPKLGRTSTHRATLVGAAAAGLVGAGVMKSMGLTVGLPHTTPLLSYTPIPLLASSFALFAPIIATQLGLAPPTSRSFTASIASATAFAYVLAGGIPGLGFRWVDLAVVASVAYGSIPRPLAPTKSTSTAHLARSYLKTIVANPESRRIFYFLMLNLCFMLVQMLYGVWTNSLGLISDAIHMAFDCMAIGMGLFASVMATWTPNEKFTYGYGRIETLSGFANGIFLLLISVFIVFEAIQRLLEPPEMNTNQLLLVSTMGLGVNLFGMFAMGGHHHHGHSHGHHHHDHSHAHAHDPGHSHSHSHEHDHDHDHEHDHSHAHSHLPHAEVSHDAHLHSHSHPHVHAQLQPHAHSHGHVHDEHCNEHDHDHDHAHDKPHVHSHPHDEKCEHDHDHHSEHDHSHRHDEHDHDHGHAHANGHAANGDAHNHPEHGHDHDHLPVPALAVTSPLTPSYRFGGADDHFATHHAHAPHAPNAHAHAHHEHEHEGHSHNMRGVFLHVMADTLGSVGVIISTLLIQWYGWTGFDPLASIFIAIMIAASVLPLVLDTARVLSLDIGPEREGPVGRALAELQHVDGVAGYTAPRFWPKDAETLIGAIHIQLARTKDGRSYASVDKVMERVDALLRERIPGLEELTIQVMAGT